MELGRTSRENSWCIETLAHYFDVRRKCATDDAIKLISLVDLKYWRNLQLIKHVQVFIDHKISQRRNLHKISAC